MKQSTQILFIFGKKTIEIILMRAELTINFKANLSHSIFCFFNISFPPLQIKKEFTSQSKEKEKSIIVFVKKGDVCVSGIIFLLPADFGKDNNYCVSYSSCQLFMTPRPKGRSTSRQRKIPLIFPHIQDPTGAAPRSSQGHPDFFIQRMQTLNKINNDKNCEHP